LWQFRGIRRIRIGLRSTSCPHGGLQPSAMEAILPWEIRCAEELLGCFYGQIGYVLCAANEAWHREPNPLSPPRALSHCRANKCSTKEIRGPLSGPRTVLEARCYGVGITA
jgi:hypothetical protein